MRDVRLLARIVGFTLPFLFGLALLAPETTAQEPQAVSAVAPAPPSLFRIGRGSVAGGLIAALGPALVYLSLKQDDLTRDEAFAVGVAAYPLGAAVGGHAAARTADGEVGGGGAFLASMLGTLATGVVVYVFGNQTNKTIRYAVAPAAWAVHTVVTSTMIRAGWKPYRETERSSARAARAPQQAGTHVFAGAGFARSIAGDGPTISLGIRREHLELSGRYMHLRKRRAYGGRSPLRETALLAGYRVDGPVSFTGAAGLAAVMETQRDLVWDPALNGTRIVEHRSRSITVPLDVGLGVSPSPALHFEFHGALVGGFLAWVGASVQL